MDSEARLHRSIVASEPLYFSDRSLLYLHHVHLTPLGHNEHAEVAVRILDKMAKNWLEQLVPVLLLFQGVARCGSLLAEDVVTMAPDHVVAMRIALQPLQPTQVVAVLLLEPVEVLLPFDQIVFGDVFREISKGHCDAMAVLPLLRVMVEVMVEVEVEMEVELLFLLRLLEEALRLLEEAMEVEMEMDSMLVVQENQVMIHVLQEEWLLEAAVRCPPEKRRRAMPDRHHGCQRPGGPRSGVPFSNIHRQLQRW